MEIKDFITNTYPVVHYFLGVNAIGDILLENGYAVVIDDNNKFQGILTAYDLIKKPHKIVIDCLTEKEKITTDDRMPSIIEKFNKCHCPALPLFRETNFIGILEKRNIIVGLRGKIDDLRNKSIISEELKYRFLSNLSHEVRTPLNAILGFLDILLRLDKEEINIEREECEGIVKKGANRFLLIMTDLVDLSLINSGHKLDINIKNVQIENIFSDLKEYFDTISSVLNKHISIEYLNPDNPNIIYSDEEKIKHILYHLIDNAIKFSNDNCTVIYGHKIKDESIVFYVKNSGLPIPEEKRMKIFEAFERQDNFNNKLVDGLGIGLTLVKKLSGLLGGEVDFISDKAQTTFFFTIPLKYKTDRIKINRIPTSESLTNNICSTSDTVYS